MERAGSGATGVGVWALGAARSVIGIEFVDDGGVCVRAWRQWPETAVVEATESAGRYVSRRACALPCPGVSTGRSREAVSGAATAHLAMCGTEVGPRGLDSEWLPRLDILLLVRLHAPVRWFHHFILNAWTEAAIDQRGGSPCQLLWCKKRPSLAVVSCVDGKQPHVELCLSWIGVVFAIGWRFLLYSLQLWL